MVVIADSGKIVSVLGNFGMPLEVLPFAAAFVQSQIGSLGGGHRMRLSERGQPFLSDQGNYIIDASFGPIRDPEPLAASRQDIPGLLEHGLFLHDVDAAYIGCNGSVKMLNRG